MELTCSRSDNRSHVVIVGAGGNIGSHAGSLIARLSDIGRLTLIDRDIYEEKNLYTQSITLNEVGKKKVAVQARRVRSINSSVRVEAVAEPVEQIPIGRLHAQVIIAGLDSRSARQYVNQVAWRLRIPWIDAGVQGDDLLARVNVYVPGADVPCLECAWDLQDYEALEQTYPCQGRESESAPTNAPASLGALAAALQALECQKLLAGQWDRIAVGRQVLIDASSHRHYVTTFQRNPHCRFDHDIWTIERLTCQPDELTLQQTFALMGMSDGEASAHALRLEGRKFVRQLTCIACKRQKPWERFTGALQQKCQCGKAFVAAGFDLQEWLNARELPRSLLKRSLRTLGVRSGDVVTLRNQTEEHHYQIGG